MKFDDGIFGLYSRLYENRREIELSLEEYLGKCSDDPSYYAGAAERMLAVLRRTYDAVESIALEGLGHDPYSVHEPQHYPEFADPYGMEETIERIVGYFRQAAQGLEEHKQILDLLGPVGGGNSSLAERLKQLMGKELVYVLKTGNEISPVFQTPHGLIDLATLV